MQCKNVIKIISNILQKLWLERNSVYARSPLFIFNLCAPINAWLDGFMYKIYEHHVVYLTVVYDILRKYISVECTLETKMKSWSKIYRNTLAFAKTERCSGTERALFKWQILISVKISCPVESIAKLTPKYQWPPLQTEHLISWFQNFIGEELHSP